MFNLTLRFLSRVSIKVRSHGAATAAATAPHQLDSIVTNGLIHTTIFTCGNSKGNTSNWVWNLFCVATAVAL